ncbi:MAG: penicillin-binding protein activator [Woeseiaceae bacterium]|nr:penicillin-binding protein activator [Woeseiaceae bacterium]
MKHRVHNPLHRWLVFAAVTLLVGGCTTVGPGAPGGERRAEQLAMAGEHAEAAGRYIGLASEATGRERDRLTLLAVEQWLDAGDGRRARSALQSVPEPGSGPLRWLWLTDTAALALWDGRPDDALALLEPLTREPLGERHRLRAEALLADAWFQKGDPIRALELYRQREAWLSSAAKVRQNRQRLWAGLLVSRPAALREAAAMADDPEIRGWLELGALAATTGQQGIGWGNGVARWRQQYPAHPATRLLDGLDLPEPGRTDYPQHVALLVPLAGESAAAGKAVQNGFFGAYFATAGDLAEPQQVSVYDSHGGTTAAYEQAVADGAGFVVGPLLRGNVTELATGSLLPVPTLALNYLPDDLLAPPAFYQFALAPEDEAVAAAHRALADGRQRALALVPRNDWGRRLLNGFVLGVASPAAARCSKRATTNPTSRIFPSKSRT